MAIVKTYYENGKIRNEDYCNVYEAENHARCILRYEDNIKMVEIYDRYGALAGYGYPNREE